MYDVSNQLTLCINKRLKNEEDKSIITQLKNKLFDKNNIPIDIEKSDYKYERFTNNE